MKTKSAVVVAVAICGIFTANAARKPNVIIILTDDQGTLDLNCYGSKDLQTPHMDAIAEQGVRFTQFYAASAICSPSRAALLTGKTPGTAGVPGNVGLSGKGLPSSEVTIAEEFKKGGYATALIGKWHLGHTQGSDPNGQGFGYFFGHRVGCIDNYSHFFYWSGPNKHDLWRNDKEVFYDGEFFPDLMVKEAGQFMEKNKAKPFFIYFAMNSPHYPYQGSPKWLKHYDDNKVPYPRNLYAAFLSTVDERIGALRKKIKDLDLEKDTIIVFQSDHGASTEGRAHGGGGNAGPHKGAKGSLYEGGIRVPSIISWPGHLPQNTVRKQLSTACDWYPTLLELCDLPPAEHKLDGKSLLPVIRSAEAPTAHSIFHWKYSKMTVVREGKWKLVIRNKKPELYDLPDDLGETKSLVKEHPEIVSRLTKQSQVYWQRAGK
mgnify:FL=1|tara:strand:- start:4986 stop:6281 length:1296 start_codon:yes stop_codon:yes gene_type:complete